MKYFLTTLGLLFASQAFAVPTLSDLTVEHVLKLSAQTAGTVLSVSSDKSIVKIPPPNANLIFSGPASGASADPTFRSIVTADLPASGVSAATYGSSTLIPVITVDVKGRITSASAVSVSAAGTGTVTSVATGTGLSGGPVTTTGTISLADTAVTPATYGSATQSPVITIDQQGRVTTASNSSISIPASAVGALDPGSILFANGSGHISQDNTHLFWNNATKSLDISGDMSIVNTLPDDTAGEAFAASVNSHMTISGDITLAGQQTSVAQQIDALAVNGKELAGNINTITRGLQTGGTDDGELSSMSGTQNLLFHNSGPGGVTDEVDGVVDLMFMEQGTVNNWYDFHSVVATGGGTIGNHYGVYIADSAFYAKNFLSGTTQLGGSSFSASTDATLALKGVGALALNKVTTAEKLSLGAEDGWMVFDTDLVAVQCYQSGSWGSCAAGGSGANTTLSNLGSTAINANLVSDTDGGYLLGSTSLAWGTLFVANISGQDATNMLIQTRQSGDATGANITLQPGIPAGPSDDVGGDVFIKGGPSFGVAGTGNVETTTEPAAGGGNSGHIYQITGSTVDGGTGAIHLTTGTPSGNGSSGGITVATGSSNNGAGGMTFVTGNSTGFAGGNMTFVTGFGTFGHGGNYTIGTGDGDTTSPGGNFTLNTGSAGSGQQGGYIFMTAGNGGGSGGYFQATAGNCSDAACTGAGAGLTAGNGGAGGTGGGISLVGGGTSDGAGAGGGVTLGTSSMSTGTPGDITFGPGINNAGASGNLIINDAHLVSQIGSSTAPSVAVQAGAGTGATCTIATGKTDTKGKITIATGTIGLSTGSYCQLTFGHAYGAAPVCVFTPASSTLSSSVYVTSSTTTMDVNFGIAGGISSTYVINYHCIQ